MLQTSFEESTCKDILIAERFQELPTQVVNLLSSELDGAWKTVHQFTQNRIPLPGESGGYERHNIGFASRECQRPPAEVEIDVPGRLLCGSMRYRLSHEWLRMEEVNNTINCAGRIIPNSKKRTNNPDWDRVHSKEARFPGIQSMDWCFGNPFDRKRADSFLRRIFTLLQDRNTTFFVHCKNGIKSSSGMIYAILRVCFGYSDADARSALGRQLITRGEVVRLRDTKLGEWKTFIDNHFPGTSR